MPPPQQQRTPGRSCAGWTTRCCVVLLFASSVVFIAWLSQQPHRPCITMSFISIRQAPSYGNPIRHFGIYYEVTTTGGGLLFYGATVNSGPAFVVGEWDRPNLNTTFIAGVIDVVVESSFSATLRAGRLPVRLQLATDLNELTRDFAVFTGLEVAIEKGTADRDGCKS